MPRFFALLFTLALLAGCQNQEQIPEQKSARTPSSADISPGPPQHWDMEDFLSRYPLPEDTDDFYAQFREAPGYSFGMIRAHKCVSTRSHIEHDLLIYIHSGNVMVKVAGRDYEAVEGDVVYIPRTAQYSIDSIDGCHLDIFAVYHPRFTGEDIIYHEPPDKEN